MSSDLFSVRLGLADFWRSNSGHNPTLNLDNQWAQSFFCHFRFIILFSVWLIGFALYSSVRPTIRWSQRPGEPFWWLLKERPCTAPGNPSW